MSLLDTESKFNLANGKAEKDLIDWLETRFRRSKDARLKFERQWWYNLSFYFGRQYVKFSDASINTELSRLFEPPAPPWRVRLVVNKCKVIIRTEHAKLIKEKPRGFVIPASTDDEDIAAAKAGEAIIDHLWRELTIPRVLRRTTWWQATAGVGYIKTWYNKGKKDSSGVQGAIEVENVLPFFIYVPYLDEEEIENQPYVIHSIAKEPEYVQDTFGVKVDPDSSAANSSLEAQYLSALGVSKGGVKDLVQLKEIWIKPCKKYKDGAVVIWGGGKVLSQVEKWPYSHGQYPFTKFDHIPTGRYYSDSALVDIIPLQKEYNRTHSQIVEAKNRMAKPQLLAPRGSVDPNKITSEPGLVIQYTPGMVPPTPLPLTALPAYVLQELDRLQMDMNDISSQHEITKGQTPPGVTAATAISYLQEQDDSKLAASIASVEEGVEKVGTQILSLVKDFWVAERQIRVLGANQMVEAQAFKAASIKGNTDFRVEAGSAIPRSRAGKQAFIMELMDKQVIPPHYALKYLDMAETAKLYEEMQLDARQAQRESLIMTEEMVEVPVNSWDNDITHIIEHDNYRKRQEFDRLDDEIKAIHEKHCMNHKLKLAAQYGQPFQPGDPMLEGFIQQLIKNGGMMPPVGPAPQAPQEQGPPNA